MSILENINRRPPKSPQINGLAKGREEDRYRSEVALVEAFTMTIADKRSCLVAHEFDSGYGIADIVLSKSSELPPCDLAALAQVPEKWAYVLRSLPYRQKFSTCELQTLTASSTRMTRHMLADFVAAGFVKSSVCKDYWIKIRQPRLAFPDVAAVEAKLSDWRRALQQACRYKQFAQSSWVLLDSVQANGALKSLGSFRTYNVGLATIDSKHHVAIHYRPELEMPRSPVLQWLANVKLARLSI